MYHKNRWKTIDDAEDLYLIMPMYNLIEYSSNYSKSTATNFDSNTVNNNDFKIFKYKAKL